MTGIFTTELLGNVVVVRLRQKSLNHRLPERAQREVTDLLTVHRQVVLDLAEITTIDGTGLKLIVKWINVSHSAGNFLVLAQCSKQLLSLLGILRIYRDVSIFPNLRDALAHFEAGTRAVAHHA